MGEATGAFIISRDIFENSIWTHPIEFRLFILILGKAVFSEEGVNVGSVHLNKGQWIRSYRNLQSDLEYIENNAVKRPGLATIKRIVEKLIKDQRILAEPCELGTLFTVINYAKYQALESYKKGTRNDTRNSSGTAAERDRNNNNNANNAKNAENELFNIFWSAYPRKVAKDKAKKAWDKINPDDVLFNLILKGLNQAKLSRDWIKDNGQFIPHPASWLNGRRWEDEYEVYKKKGGSELNGIDEW